MPRPLVTCLVLFAVCCPSSVRGQIVNVTEQTATPIPGASHDYIHMINETVDPSTGSLSLRIGVPMPPGRLLAVPFSFAYDSSGSLTLQTDPIYGYGTRWFPNLGPLVSGGWSYAVPQLSRTGLQQNFPNGFADHSTVCNVTAGYVFTDPSGSRHALGLSHIYSGYVNGLNSDACKAAEYVERDQGGDSVYQAQLYQPLSRAIYDQPNDGTPIVVGPDNTAFWFGQTYGPGDCGLGSGGGTTFISFPGIEDRNGNLVTVGASGTGCNTLTAYDTLNHLVLSGPNFGQNGSTLTVAGLSNPYTLAWGNASYNFSVVGKQVDVDLGPGCWSGSHTYSTGSGSNNVLTAITLPNGEKYQFAYDPTYGTVSKVTYPSGGYVSYTWGVNPLSTLLEYPLNATGTTSPQCAYQLGAVAVLHRYVSFDGSTVALQQDFSYSTTWGSTGQSDAWSAKQTTVTTHDLVAGTTFTTVYNYVPLTVYPPVNMTYAWAGQLPLPQSVVYNGTNGTTLRTVTKNWFDQFSVACELVTLDAGSVMGAFYTYAPGVQVNDKKEYDYGLISSATACQNQTSAPSGVTPTRETAINYQTFAATPNFPGIPSILDRPSSVITYGNGSRVAETDYAYDQNTTAPASATKHDETNYAPGSSAPRGNPTTVTKQCFPSCTNAVTTYSYDETGQVLTSKDPCGNTTCSDMTGTTHTTGYTYTDSYSSCGGTAPPSGSTNAYLTKVTDPLGHITSFCYGYNDGQLRGATDENGQTTTYAYNDSLDRLTAKSFPDGGQISYSYNDTPPTPTVTATELATPSPSITAVTVMDGVGHVTQSQTTSVSPPIMTTTTYNGLGLVHTVSNPHVSTSSSTDGTTTYTYDALGRTIKVVKQDGSSVSTTYSGNTTTTTDEALHQRETVTDALGRLKSVTEDPTGLNYLTNYTYDALNDQLTVVQAGSRSRTFQYDSLSRLTSSSNPEIAGTVNYSYDANGNVSTKTAPAPNQTGSARFTASMTYDVLNRILSKTYTGGSPTAALSFTYDVSSVDSLSGLTNPIGKLVKDSAVSSAGTVSFYHDYDKMGRTAGVWECVPFNCPSTWSSSYQYDYAGNLTSYSDTTFAAYTQTFDGAGRLTKLTSTWPSGTATTFATVNDFFPPGQIQEMTYANGLAVSNVYNPRLQPCRINFNSSAAVLQHCTDALPLGNLLDFNYGYNAGTSDNGNVMSWVAAGRQTFSHSYAYDTLNRISSMSGSGGSCTALNWTYDAWGNREDQTAPPGGGTCLQPQYTYLSNNQISGYGYDSAGNLTSQNGATYTYDNENRLVSETTSGVTATYVYDASGRRVQKTVGSNPPTFYEYNKDGQIYGWLAPGGRQLGYAYMNGQVLAQYQNGTTYFHHHDHLGSTRLVSELNQVIEQCNGYYPFGEVDNNQCTPTALNDFTDTLFSGKERDSESNLDNFEARYMASSMGRFMSPDPDNAGADDQDPQTWNAYSYVRNNPLNLTDPDGRATTDFLSCGFSTWGSGGCGLEGPRDQPLIGRELNDSISNGGPVAAPAPTPAYKFPWWRRFVNWFNTGEPLSDEEIESYRGWLIRHYFNKDMSQPDFHKMSSWEVVRLYDSVQWGLLNDRIPVISMLGAGGVQVTSKTLWEEEGARIDVENPNPGQRPGQIHYQDSTGKYIYDPETGTFKGLSATKNGQILGERSVQAAIQKGLRYLGVSK